MTTVRRLAIPALTCACGLLQAVTGSGAAVAAEPERTGWWNRVSAGGVVLPQPTAQAGDLRVASGPDAPTAYAAVMYTAPGAPRATLNLGVRSRSGTAEVVACPTETTDWPQGPNQPYDKAPVFDCQVGLASGSLSEDGKTLSFALDPSTQTEPGVWSLALVPKPENQQVFTMDIVEPGPQAFQAETPSDPGPDGSLDSGSSTPPQNTNTSGASGEAFTPGAFEAPPTFDTGTAEGPMPAPATAPEPAGAAGAPGATTPLRIATPAAGVVVEDLGSGRRLLALLVLVGGIAAVGYAAGQQRPGPRLLGGRSRLVAATAAVPAPVGAPQAQERPRGIGRFAKSRDAAPRRLR